MTCLDTDGILALLHCQADAQQLDCRIRLVRPQPMVYRTLQVAGLLQLFGLTKAHRNGPERPQTAGPAMGLVGSGIYN